MPEIDQELLEEVLQRPVDVSKIRPEDLEAFVDWLNKHGGKEKKAPIKTCKGCYFYHPENYFHCSILSTDCINSKSKTEYMNPSEVLIGTGQRKQALPIPKLNGYS